MVWRAIRVFAAAFPGPLLVWPGAFQVTRDQTAEREIQREMSREGWQWSAGRPNPRPSPSTGN
jgi:hypothetical protein